jgi:hypothetical protein
LVSMESSLYHHYSNGVNMSTRLWLSHSLSKSVAESHEVRYIM